MIKDKQMIMAQDQAITVAAASEDYLVNQAENLGISQDLNFVVEVKQAFTGLDSGMTIKLQSGSDTAFSDAVDEITSATIAAAALTLGAKFQFRLPAKALKKYIRAYFTPVSEAATAGKVDAFITQGVDDPA